MSLLRVFKDSFTILTENLVLGYPFILFLMLTYLSDPRDAVPTDGNMKWILLVAVLLLLNAAFMSGWGQMIGTAVTRLIERDPDQPEDRLKTAFGAISLFKAFFPGVSHYFAPFMMGRLIQVGILFIVYWIVEQVITQQIGIPPVFEQFTIVKTEAEVKALVEALSSEQINQLFNIMMLGFFALILIGLFYLVTIFWEALVILNNLSVLDAYKTSISHAFRNPFRILGLGILIGLSYFVSYLILVGSIQSGVILISAILQLFILLMTIYFAIVPFSYTAQFITEPQNPEKLEDTSPESPEME